MIIQYVIVGLIVLLAFSSMAVRLFRFFKTPDSKCEGCSGCKLRSFIKTNDHLVKQGVE